MCQQIYVTSIKYMIIFTTPPMQSDGCHCVTHLPFLSFLLLHRIKKAFIVLVQATTRFGIKVFSLDTKCLFPLSIKLSLPSSLPLPCLLLLRSLPPSLRLSHPACLPAPGTVSSFTEQLKVTGTEREGEGGRDRGRTHHSIARGYTTAEEEREMEGQR